MELFFDTPDNTEITGTELLQRIQQGGQKLYIISPYVSISGLGPDLLEKMVAFTEVKIIVDINEAGCDPFSLQDLLLHKNVEIKTISSIHAKLFVVDYDCYIGSVNLTNAGFKTNIELLLKPDLSNHKDALTEWFTTLWTSNIATDVRTLNKSEWRELMAKWKSRSARSNKKLPHFSDLIFSGELDDRIMIGFVEESNLNIQEDINSSKKTEDPYENGCENWFLEDSYKSQKYWIAGYRYYNEILMNSVADKAILCFFYKKNEKEKTIRFTSTTPDLIHIFFTKKIKATQDTTSGRYKLVSFYNPSRIKMFRRTGKETKNFRDLLNSSVTNKNTKEQWDKYFFDNDDNSKKDYYLYFTPKEVREKLPAN